MNTKVKYIFSLLMVLLLLSACSDKENAEGNPEEDGGEAVSQDGGELVLAVLSDAATLDPHTATDVPTAAVLTNVVEGLVQKDKNGELVPLLAKSWEAIDDTTWEFKLQEGIKFHDGEDFNAEAVKKNFERILDPAVAAPRPSCLKSLQT